jgi:hypothetical protein
LNVVLVVPDAGPLISLGRADRLPVILSLGLPVYVVDQVFFEVTQDKRFPDAERIERFVRTEACVHAFETAVGKAAAERRARGETRQPGQGEAAIAEFLSRIEEITGNPDSPVLMLFEDSDVQKRNFILPGNVHIISTWALLLGLQRKGLIASAQDIWDGIEAAGRHPSTVNIDQPSNVGPVRTKW